MYSRLQWDTPQRTEANCQDTSTTIRRKTLCATPTPNLQRLPSLSWRGFSLYCRHFFHIEKSNNIKYQPLRREKHMVPQENIESMARIIRGVGITTFLVGVIVLILLISLFSRPSFFSSEGQLSPTELFISVLVAFYHLVLGLLCLGIAQILSSFLPPTLTENVDTETTEPARAIENGQRCSQCGENNPDNFEFCWNCGASLKTTKGGA